MRIGTIIKIKNDFKIKTTGDKTIQINKGDKAFVDGTGCVRYLTGNAKGKIQKIKDYVFEGYNYEDIAELIFYNLDLIYDLKAALNDSGIDEAAFKEDLQDILIDIF